MRMLLFLLFIGIGFTSCETTVESTIEGDPIQMQGSFLLEGSNILTADNPTSLSDYADHIGTTVTEIKSVHPKNIQVSVTDNVADSLLFNSMQLMVSAKEQDTLKIAMLDTVEQGVIKHKMKLADKNELLPYFKADNFQWMMNCNLEEDYEETLPIKVMMELNISHSAN